MSAVLKRLPLGVLGLALAVLIAGSASAQDTEKAIVLISPGSCPAAPNGGSLTFSPAAHSFFTCAGAGSDIQVSNPIVAMGPPSGSSTLDCTVAFVVRLTDIRSGQSGDTDVLVHFTGTLTNVQATTTATLVSVSPSTLTLGCKQYTISTIAYSHPEIGVSGSLSARVVCTCLPAPAITCPPNQTIECPGTVPPVATDLASFTAAGGTVGPNPTGCMLTLISSDTSTPGTCPGTGTVVRTYTLSNPCGNSPPCQQTFTLVDTTPPTIGQPGANATIQCPATPVFTPPTASDTCGGATVHLVSDVTTPGTCPGTFTETRTWNATDCSGNTSGNVSQTITVRDTTPPTITCPADVTVATPNDVPPPDVTKVMASDTCGATTVTFVGDTGSCPTITRTYRATDACGNTNTCTQTIHITNCGGCTPQITCPPNILICLPPGVCSATGVTITPTVNPTCPGTTLVCTRSDGLPLTAPYPLGSTIVTCSVTDATGRVLATCTTTVTVLSRGQNEVNVYVAAINGVPTTGTPDQVTIRVGDRLTLAMVVTIPSCGTFNAVTTGLVTFSTSSSLNLGTFSGNVFTAGPGAANKQFPIYGRFTNPCTGTTFTDTIHVTVRP